MAKATHYGTCQACGKRHKLPNGRLSKHGYTVTWNSFWNVCRGEKELPYEKSCDLIEFLIKEVNRQKDLLNEEITELETTVDYAWLFESHKISRFRRKSVAVKKYAEDLEWSESHLKWTGSDGNPQKFGYWGGESKEAAITEANKRRIQSLKQQITGCENYVKWQQGRIDNWEEKELELIAEEVEIKKEVHEFENRREAWGFSSKKKKEGFRTMVRNNKWGGAKVTVYLDEK